MDVSEEQMLISMCEKEREGIRSDVDDVFSLEMKTNDEALINESS